MPGQLRQAEVEQLGGALFGQHHVAGFEVAVNHALPVGGREGVRDLGRDRERVLNRQRPFLETLGERLAREVLHH